MINKVITQVPPSKIDKEGVKFQAYLHNNYVETLEKYREPSGVRHNYRDSLINFLEECSKLGRLVTIIEVLDSKHSDRMVYVDYTNIRTYDIPLKCFTINSLKDLSDFSVLKDFE